MPDHSDMPRLDAAALADLVSWRRELHRHPEVSGHEAATAARVAARIKAARPDALLRERHGLGIEITHHDVVAHCENAPEAVARLAAALEAEAIPHGPQGQPMRASEDFGRFGIGATSALMLLGAGLDRPALHKPVYDFPDALIETGLRCFVRLTGDLLGYD
ncbi:MAG: metal-dependent amidase/aminoacylase/carboxypeptidase family protein [Limimaricola cinnabarinus]|jgi:metal-dependent amidase/aminoacylase/carboxypeptidase family protein|uniref:hypothetical protein n=1 Tax=Limimaricola cinnabarinus TaxID=1125964 RepID=UPI0039E22E80